MEQTTEQLSGMLEMHVEKIIETPVNIYLLAVIANSFQVLTYFLCIQQNYRLKVIDLTKLALNKFNAMFGAVDWIKTKGATGSFPQVGKPLFIC